MAAIPSEAWFAIALVIGGAVLAFLHVLACVARNECAIHDMRRSVVELQNQYAHELEALAHGPKEGGVDIVDDDGDTPDAATPIEAGQVVPEAAPSPAKAA